MSSGRETPTGLLLLFDVDGTLVARATEAHSAALHQALQEIHGVDARRLEQVRLSLVTGNYEPVARLKLRRAGIGHYFASGQGGFGSDSEDRASLPPLARRRAGHDGVPFPRAQTLVIGDTPHDIACARADDLRCFAVATGPYGPDVLSDADGVAADASHLRPLLAEALAALAA